MDTINQQSELKKQNRQEGFVSGYAIILVLVFGAVVTGIMQSSTVQIGERKALVNAQKLEIYLDAVNAMVKRYRLLYPENTDTAISIETLQNYSLLPKGLTTEIADGATIDHFIVKRVVEQLENDVYTTKDQTSSTKGSTNYLEKIEISLVIKKQPNVKEVVILNAISPLKRRVKAVIYQ